MSTKPSPFVSKIVKPGPFSSKADSSIVKSGPNISKADSSAAKPGPFSFKVDSSAVNPGPFSSKADSVTVKPGPFSSKTMTSAVKPPSSSTTVTTTVTVSSISKDKPNKIIISRKSTNMVTQLPTTFEQAETVEDVVSILNKNNSNLDIIKALNTIWKFNLPDRILQNRTLKSLIKSIYPLIYSRIDSFSFSEIIDFITITAVIIIKYNLKDLFDIKKEYEKFTQQYGQDKYKEFYVETNIVYEDNIILKSWLALLDNFILKTAPLELADVINLMLVFTDVALDPGQEIMDILNEGVINHLNMFSSKQLALVLYSYSKLGYIPHPDLLADFKIEILNSEFDLEGIANILASFHFFNYELNVELLDSLLENFKRTAYPTNSQGARYVGDILAALYFFDYDPGRDFITLCFRIMGQPGMKMQPQNIADLLLAAGYFNYDLKFYPRYIPLFENMFMFLRTQTASITWSIIMDILNGLYYLNILDKNIMTLLSLEIIDFIRDAHIAKIDLEDLLFIFKCYNFFNLKPKNTAVYFDPQIIEIRSNSGYIFGYILEYITKYYNNLTEEQLDIFLSTITKLKYDPGHKIMFDLAKQINDKYKFRSYFAQLNYDLDNIEEAIIIMAENN